MEGWEGEIRGREAEGEQNGTTWKGIRRTKVEGSEKEKWFSYKKINEMGKFLKRSAE